MKTMKFAIAFGATMTAAGLAAAQVVGVATNPQGSLGYRTGIAVAKVVTAKTDVTARAQPMAGSTTYIPMLNRGEIPFGFTNGGELQHAYEGVGTFNGRPQPNLRLVGAMFPLRSGIAVAKDTGLMKISDLQRYKGKRITAKYTSLAIIQDFMGACLANGGVSHADFKLVPVSGFAKGIFALGAGKADITWISLGSGAGRKVMTQLRGRGGWRYLDLDITPAAKARFKQLAPALDIVLESNTKMPGVEKPTHIVQMQYVMLTGKDMDAEVVYKATKALAQNQGMLAKSMGAFRRNKRELMGSLTLTPYHPGAIKAYQELGIKTAR
jgi:TRAP transporter TAXI family solute receptor